jgi:isopenicillin N synthase-like dioxygenase
MNRAQSDFIPVVDLDGLYGGLEERRRVGRQMGAACERSGFLVIVNHRIPAEVIDRMYSLTKAFFALPREEKMKVAMEFVSDARKRTGGYRPPGVSALARTLDVESPPDLVETFSMQPLPGHGRNKWPARPPGFEAAWKEYYRTLDQLAMRLMRGFALALELPEDWFDDKFDRQTKYTTMLANYYPAQPTPPLPGQLRRGAHSDYGSLTILYQDEAPGGLQVRDETGTWSNAPLVPGSFMVNIGDLMAHWTNDRWVSTMHRVVNPQRENAGRDRLSIPFFHQPDAEAIIACIPSCQSAANPAKYPPVTSAEWRDGKGDKAVVGYP